MSEFEVNDETIIGWGKLKGKQHKELLKKSSESYCNWILSQGSLFRYKASRDYIIQNKDNKEVIEMRDLIHRIIGLSREIDWDKQVILRQRMEDLKIHLNNILG